MKKIIILLMFLTALAANADKIRQQDVKVAINVAVKYYENGDCAEAMPILDELLTGSYPLVNENSALEYTLTAYAGFCARELGENDKALSYFSKTVRLGKTLDINGQIPVYYAFIGGIYERKGDYKKAILYYSGAILGLDGADENDKLEIASLWYLLSVAHKNAGENSEALDSCAKSSQIASEIKNVTLQVACSVSNGEIYLNTGDYSNAIKKYNKGLTLARNNQMPIEMADSYLGLAKVYEHLDKPDLARQNYDEALRLYYASSAVDNVPLLTGKLIELVGACKKDLLKKNALNYLEYAESFHEAGSSAVAGLYLLAGVYFEAANDERAEENFQKSLALSMMEGYCTEALNAETALTSFYASRGKYDLADEIVNTAVKYHNAIKDKSCSQELSGYIVNYQAKKSEV